MTDEHAAAQVLHLYEALEEGEDAQNVHSSFEIPRETFVRLVA